MKCYHPRQEHLSDSFLLRGAGNDKELGWLNLHTLEGLTD